MAWCWDIYTFKRTHTHIYKKDLTSGTQLLYTCETGNNRHTQTQESVALSSKNARSKGTHQGTTGIHKHHRVM